MKINIQCGRYSVANGACIIVPNKIIGTIKTVAYYLKNILLPFSKISFW